MNKDILNTLILAGAFLTLFATAEVMFHLLKIKAELTRKFVHLGTGLLTLLFPIMLGNHWLVLILCASFAVILLLSLRFNLLKSINAIDRKSVGSLAYPVSVYGCYLVFDYFDQQYIYFYLPILILAICDPIAALTGKTWPYGSFKVGMEKKTLVGSGMFFISALVLTFALYLILHQESTTFTLVITAFVVAMISTVSEAFSRKGYDNLTIPAAVLVSMILTEKLLA